MKKFIKALGCTKAQAFHAFVTAIFMVAAMITIDGLCLLMAVIGFFYGLYNYCMSINFNNIEE